MTSSDALPKEFSARVVHKWLIPALLEWAAIILLFVIGYQVNSIWMWMLITVIIGSRQHAIGILGHDGAHCTASHNKRLNDLLSDLFCFWPNCTTVADFRRFHFAHHRHFNTERDPELIYKHIFCPDEWQIPISPWRLWGLFIGDLIGLGIPSALKAHKLLGITSARSYIGPAVWWLVVGGGLIAAGLWIVVVVWFVALVTSFWAFFRMRSWIEHVGTTSTHRLRANWWQKLFVTPHASWTHYEHHIHPNVAFWKRPDLRKPDDATIGMWELFRSFGSAQHTAEHLRIASLRSTQ